MISPTLFCDWDLSLLSAFVVKSSTWSPTSHHCFGVRLRGVLGCAVSGVERFADLTVMARIARWLCFLVCEIMVSGLCIVGVCAFQMNLPQGFYEMLCVLHKLCHRLV